MEIFLLICWKFPGSWGTINCLFAVASAALLSPYMFHSEVESFCQDFWAFLVCTGLPGFSSGSFISRILPDSSPLLQRESWVKCVWGKVREDTNTGVNQKASYSTSGPLAFISHSHQLQHSHIYQNQPHGPQGYSCILTDRMFCLTRSLPSLIPKTLPCDAQGVLQFLHFFQRCLLHSRDCTGASPVDLHICLFCVHVQILASVPLQHYRLKTQRTSGTWKSLGCQPCPRISRLAFVAGMGVPDYYCCNNHIGEMKQFDLVTRHSRSISLLFCPPAKGTQNPASTASSWHWVITNTSLRFD